MKKTLLALSMLLAFQNVSAVDLISAYQAAKANDAAYASAKKLSEVGKEKIQQADALKLPQVSLSANTTRTYTDYQAGKGTGSYDKNGNSYGYTLSASQPLYRGDLSATASQLRKQADLSEVQLRVAEQDLILRVAKAYFEVVAAEEKIRVTQAQKEAITQQLAQAKKSFEVGLATITDTDEAQSRFDAMQAQEIAAINDLDVKREAFEQITALVDSKVAPIGDKQQPMGPMPNDLNAWRQRAEAGNFVLASQQLNLDISRREIDKYRASTAPKLDLFGSYGDAWRGSSISSSGGKDRTTTGTIGVQLSVPLYTGGNRSSQFREAVVREDAQRSTVEAARRDAVQSAQRAFLGVQSGAAQIRALQQALVSGKSLVDSTTLGRQVGARTTLDVLNAQQQYYSTRYDLTVARYNYLYAKLQLAAAVGELKEADLAEINNWLE